MEAAHVCLGMLVHCTLACMATAGLLPLLVIVQDVQYVCAALW